LPEHENFLKLRGACNVLLINDVGTFSLLVQRRAVSGNGALTNVTDGSELSNGAIDIYWKERGDMTIRLALLAILVVALACADPAVTPSAAAGEEVPRMTIGQVKDVLGNPNYVILDVRKSSDWEGSDSKIQGAIREDPSNVNAWIDKYPKDKILLFYCK
jgi:hypothetical protein